MMTMTKTSERKQVVEGQGEGEVKIVSTEVEIVGVVEVVGDDNGDDNIDNKRE